MAFKEWICVWWKIIAEKKKSFFAPLQASKKINYYKERKKPDFVEMRCSVYVTQPGKNSCTESEHCVCTQENELRASSDSGQTPRFPFLLLEGGYEVCL